jgi:hypothetical protein
MKNNLVVEKKKVPTTTLENQYFFTRNELKEAKGNTVNETQGITEMKIYFIFFSF